MDRLVQDAMARMFPGGRRRIGQSPEEHMAEQRAAYYGSLPDNLPNSGSAPFMVKGVLGEARGSTDDDVRAALAKVAGQKGPAQGPHYSQWGKIRANRKIGEHVADTMPALGGPEGRIPGATPGPMSRSVAPQAVSRRGVGPADTAAPMGSPPSLDLFGGSPFAQYMIDLFDPAAHQGPPRLPMASKPDPDLAFELRPFDLGGGEPDPFDFGGYGAGVGDMVQRAIARAMAAEMQRRAGVPRPLGVQPRQGDGFFHPRVSGPNGGGLEGVR